MTASIESNASAPPGGVYPPVKRLVDALRSGDTRALARAISLVENEAPEAPALLSACFPHTGRALRIGVTGSPGAGKSTLVDRLARHFRQSGRTVGVLAVDPTSPFTGGALLGDRIRFQEHHEDAGFYARSMATRGSLGGLALATSDAALVLEASGKEILLIETVGVGQDEIEIARLADVTLVVLVPGMGDDVQSLKAGVMEIADIYVINKSDRDGAHRVEQEIRTLQSLAPNRHKSAESWTPPIVRTIATAGEGTDQLAAAISQFEEWLKTDHRRTTRRALHWRLRLDAMLRAELMRRARRHGLTPSELDEHASRIASGQENPWQLVPQLAAKLFSTDY